MRGVGQKEGVVRILCRVCRTCLCVFQALVCDETFELSAGSSDTLSSPWGVLLYYLFFAFLLCNRKHNCFYYSHNFFFPSLYSRSSNVKRWLELTAFV